jgi:ABC-2 type transport system permease protein/lipopolysaccharide transport system permease protein
MRLGVQDVKLKFRRSSIGPAWIFVNLAVLVLSIGFIYANLLGQQPREFIPYLTIGLILWQYLTNSIVEGGNAFVHSEGYIRQISLPIYVYILRFFVSISLTTLITLIAFVLVAIIYRVPVGPGTLLAIPGWLMLMTTSLLLITIFAHLNTRFRDIAHMASVGMQVLFYVTPVIYPAALLTARRRLMPVIQLNPLYHVIEVVRQPLLSASPASPQSYLAMVVIIAGLFATAVIVIAMNQRRIVFSL